MYNIILCLTIWATTCTNFFVHTYITDQIVHMYLFPVTILPENINENGEPIQIIRRV